MGGSPAARGAIGGRGPRHRVYTYVGLPAYTYPATHTRISLELTPKSTHSTTHIRFPPQLTPKSCQLLRVGNRLLKGQ